MKLSQATFLTKIVTPSGNS